MGECGNVFDKVCDVGLEEVGPVEADCGLHPVVENQWRENKHESGKWVSYGGSRL